MKAPRKQKTPPVATVSDVSWLGRRLGSGPSGLSFTILLIIAGIGLALFGGLLEGIHEHSTVAHLDVAVGQTVIGWRRMWLTPIMETFTALAGVRGSALFVILCVTLLYRRASRSLAWLMALGTAGEVALAVTLKLIVARPRPNISGRLVQAQSFSFPSGHTLAAVVIFGLAAYIIGRGVHSARTRSLITLIWILFVIGVATSRIYLGVHFFSDTLASAALGAATLSLGLGWLHRQNGIITPTAFSPSSSRRVASALGITFVAVLIGRSFFL